MIWHRRAALNTPWNPWMDPNLLARYEADYAGTDFRLYDATHLDRINSLDLSGNANKIAVQNTPAKMQTFTTNDADFAGHGAIVTAASQGAQTAAWLCSFPYTLYFAVKFNGLTTGQLITDGIVIGTRAPNYSLGAQFVTGSGQTIAFDAKNIVVFGCVRPISTGNSKTILNGTTYTGGSGTLIQPNGVTIGNDYTMSTFPCYKIAHLSYFGGTDSDALAARKLAWITDKYT